MGSEMCIRDSYEHLEKKGIAVDRESGEIYRPKEPDVDES